jgi:hypothetical protein
MLGQLNKNQGMGFVVFGVVCHIGNLGNLREMPFNVVFGLRQVLDKAVLYRLLVKLGTLTATAVTTMLALQPPVAAAPALCELRADEKEAFATVARLLNASCTYNLTVGRSGSIN